MIQAISKNARLLGVMVLLVAMFGSLLATPVFTQPAGAAERAYFRIVDHPRVEKFQTKSSPSADWLLKTRIDALWNPRHTGEVEISIQIVRKSGNKWVAAGPPVTRNDSDGNLTVFAEGIAQPGGTYEYAAQWNARAKGAKAGVDDWSRPNERGPAVKLTAPGSKPVVELPGAIPTVAGKTPDGCLQKVHPGKKTDRTAAVAVAIVGCPDNPYFTAASQGYKVQICRTPGIEKCILGWKTIDSHAAVKGSSGQPRTNRIEVSHRTVPTRWRYRVIMDNPKYLQSKVPPRTRVYVQAPDIQAQYVLGGYSDAIDWVVK